MDGPPVGLELYAGLSHSRCGLRDPGRADDFEVVAFCLSTTWGLADHARSPHGMPLNISLRSCVYIVLSYYKLKYKKKEKEVFLCPKLQM